MKRCTKCKEFKPYEEFNKDSSRGDGLDYKCKLCKSLLYQSNRDDILKKRSIYYQENREYILSFQKEWGKRNPHKINQQAAKRRAWKKKQTPDLTKSQEEYIDYLYWLARDLRAITGEDYHVDHIYPLSKGGLHHPDNLQILPSDLNLKKGSKV